MNMNTRQIDSIFHSDPHTQSVFLGVFARDKSPQRVGWPEAFVWNLGTSKKPGSHWVAVYIDLRGRGYYFDSYDLPLLNKKFENFVNRSCVWWNFNRTTLQAPFSTVCGQCCVYFMLYMVNRWVPLCRVFLEMRLKTIVLLRSSQMRIFAEFVNKSPWHHVC